MASQTITVGAMYLYSVVICILQELSKLSFGYCKIALQLHAGGGKQLASSPHRGSQLANAELVPLL